MERKPHRQSRRRSTPQRTVTAGVNCRPEFLAPDRCFEKRRLRAPLLFSRYAASTARRSSSPTPLRTDARPERVQQHESHRARFGLLVARHQFDPAIEAERSAAQQADARDRSGSTTRSAMAATRLVHAATAKPQAPCRRRLPRRAATCRSRLRLRSHGRRCDRSSAPRARRPRAHPRRRSRL